MAQEFQNMKTTHSWINLITRAPVQVLHFSFRDLHGRFEAFTDDWRPLRTICDLHKMMSESMLVGLMRDPYRSSKSKFGTVFLNQVEAGSIRVLIAF